MSELSSELGQATSASQKPPAGWEPYAEEVGRVGSAIVNLPTPSSTERDLLITAGFDPELWQIFGPINTRRWMRYDQEWLYYYKFDVVQGESAEAREVNVDELAAWLRKKRHRLTTVTEPAASDVYAMLLSDWQIGKRLGEDDSKKTAERVADTIDQAVQEAKRLRRLGYQIEHGALLGLGDLGEGTCGFYPGQQFTVDLNRRDQNKVVRELIAYAIDGFAGVFDKLTVATVGGNHGENRSIGGKVITNEADNDDVAQFEAVKEAFDRAGDPGITWVIPEDELSMQLNLGGVGVGMTHGHLYQRGRGGSAQGKALEWWKGQDFGGHELRGAQVLVSAHFHHFSATTYGRKTHVQTPPMDPGSKWFADILGQDSPPGAVVMRFDNTQMLGFDHLRILEPGS